ncbi:DUF952 domain-containing protein [Demetria terragena]|uniref:DUF952 domain-containing protein n=1 Tax=Demetria terragena TaxID=63959 RepID=UPI00037192F7|nr:DUF952 domain-containing protein [Demetria terragena]
MSTPLFHLALPSDWEEAQRRGVYEISTRGATLTQVGFMHLSYEHQWPQVRAAFYGDVEELVLLTIDAEQIEADVVVEVGNPQTGEEFPHLYAPLPVAAVREVRVLSGDAEALREDH